MPEPAAGPPLLPFPPGCIRAAFLRREKRFTVVLRDAAGGLVLGHTNNTGAMRGLLHRGAPALLSPARAPRRKLKWTLEALGLGLDAAHPRWAGVNTLAPNRMLAAAWRSRRLPEALAYPAFRPEVPSGESRIDGLFTGGGLPPLYVECKNVTLVEGEEAQFPDAASERGRRHLAELMRLARLGARTALFFLVQRPDGRCFAPAEAVDPSYAAGFAAALKTGVEAWVRRGRVDESGVDLGERIPLAPAWAALAQRPRA